MRDDGERLQDILEAISQIEKYAAQGKDKINACYSIAISLVRRKLKYNTQLKSFKLFV
ncbi:hypothetical protein Xen7305DRAFT_00032240 [Xenococcus sp. PCC 7305]|nr:hypothetical protein [Xenococcus sp. PCC 7305]ELS03500.1 hypothetical protein Xen7305DRAFT_00032240 [Xenococcus sp. PCC 7305]